MPIEAIKLHFTTPLHIGRGMAELNKTAAIYHSDAFKSALYAIGINYFPQWENEPDTFFNSFQISSLFPFCGAELFLPKPYYKLNLNFQNTSEEKKAKKAKKISFISADVLKQWMLQKDKEIVVTEDMITTKGGYLFGKAKAKDFLHTEVQQRVQVPAEGDEGDSRPFYFDRLYFDDGAGLYFLAHFQNNSIRQQVMQALTILGDEGIGTDRTVGNGLFTFRANEHTSPFNLPEVKQGTMQMNLGLYLPAEEEVKAIDFDNSYWQLIKRGGYIGGSSNPKFLSLRKNGIYFFTEGSVWATPLPLNGKYENLKPAYNDNDLHPVYRCGQPLFITF